MDLQAYCCTHFSIHTNNAVSRERAYVSSIYQLYLMVVPPQVPRSAALSSTAPGKTRLRTVCIELNSQPLCKRR